MNTDSTARPSAAWRKSSYSNATGDCVEVAPAVDGVLVRHSKRPSAGIIAFPFPVWAAFVREARDGSASANGVATVTKVGTDTLVRSCDADVELRFDADEWAAFVAAATDGEFDFAGKLTSAAT